MAKGKKTGASDKVRACIAGGPVDRATVAERTKVDADTVAKIVYGGVRRGEWLDEEGALSVNPDYVKGRRASAPGKKLKGNRAALRDKRARKKGKATRVPSMRALADKVCAPAITPFSHVRTTLEGLRSVLNLEACDAMIVQAFRSHDEAVLLAAGG
jgi:hypothetical protein